MSDLADVADVEIERGMTVALANIRNAPPAALPTGFCLECDEPVASGHRWCGAECRDQWCARNEA